MLSLSKHGGQASTPLFDKLRVTPFLKIYNKKAIRVMRMALIIFLQV